MSDEIRMAVRDATPYNYPSQDRRVVYHAHRGDFVSACAGVLLVEESDQAVADAPESLRCRRPACRALWKDQP